MDKEELNIIPAFKQKDAKAFACIFKLHRKALVYFAEKILGIREEAEDIVADSFMKLWAKHADFESLPQIKSFLYVVTRNSCLNFLKYAKRVSALQKELNRKNGGTGLVSKDFKVLSVVNSAIKSIK